MVSDSQQQWRKIGKTQFAFTQNETTVASMDIALGTMNRKAQISIADTRFTIEKVGFWKNTIEISDADGKVIATAYHEKWYANAMILDYRGHAFKLLIRNNPLAEWAIVDDGNDVLAYGLTTSEGKAAIKITASVRQHDLLLDCLLWYLFLPIAMENADDNALFLLLATA